MALNNLYSTSGGIYVRPVGFGDCYPVSGFPHGCKSLLPPSAALTMHSYTSHKPSSRTSAAMSPLQVAQQQNPALSPYNNHLLNSNHTSSFAAALQKLAKQAGEPTTENGISSGNLNHSATLPPMYLTGHQNSFSGNSSPSVTVAPIQFHNSSSRKVPDVTSFTPAVTNSGQLSDPLRTKFSSLSHSSQTEKWDENTIGTKEYLASSAHAMSLPVASSAASTSDESPARGFQPYRLVEERQHHLSSHFSMYDASYPYHPTFLPAPHLSPHAYRLEDAFYLERYGLLRTPMVHFPATPGLISHPHAGYYQPGAYSSDLLSHHMSLSSQNFLLEQERLKREEQRLWAENREAVKLREQDVDKTKLSGSSDVNGQLSPVVLPKTSEFPEKRNGCVKNVIPAVENRKLLSPGCHSAPLNLTIQTKTENNLATCRTPDQNIHKSSRETKCDNSERKSKAKNVHPEVQTKSSSEIKRTKSDVNVSVVANLNKSDSSSPTNLDKEKLFSLCQRNDQEFFSATKGYESHSKLFFPIEEGKRTEKIETKTSEKKFRPFELTQTDYNKAAPHNMFSTPFANGDTYSQSNSETTRSKLDLEQQRWKNAQQYVSDDDYDSDSDEGKYHFLHIVLKGPPLPLDASPEKLKFFENFNLITEKKKREMELQKLLDRRERLKETSNSPPIEVEEVKEEEPMSDKSFHHSCVLQILVDKMTFMEVLKLYPSTSTNIGASDGKCGIKRTFEKMLQCDEISSENITRDSNSPSGPSPKYVAVHNEHSLRKIPLVHSAHLYRNLCITCQSEKCKYPATSNQKLYLNGSRRMSLLRCSKRHQYTKLWVPTKKKLELTPPVPDNQSEKPASKCQDIVNNVDVKRSAGLSLDDDHNVESSKHLYICDTKESSQNIEHCTTKSPYKWPGIEAVIESYKIYATEQNLEREILKEKCQSLMEKHTHLTQQLENMKNQMLKLLSLKDKLEENRKSYQTSIDNLKRCLEEIR